MTNICGVLVQAGPDRAAAVGLAFAGLEGVELHACDARGRLVVTVEDTAAMPAHDRIMQIHQIPGVISLTLAYHSFEVLDMHAAPAA